MATSPKSNGATTSNILSSAGKSDLQFYSRAFGRADRTYSLEKEPTRRATPWRMLEHPWMVEMKGKKKVSMEKFLGQVWDWKE